MSDQWDKAKLQAEINTLRAELAAAHGNADDNYKKLMKTRAELAAANALAEQRLRGWVDEGKEKDALRAELAAERERNAKLAEDNIRRSNGIVQVEAERDALRAQLAEACEALEGWQSWWDLPWEAKRPDVAQLRYNRARAVLEKTKGGGDECND